jgi:dienelactone hydrolase
MAVAVAVPLGGCVTAASASESTSTPPVAAPALQAAPAQPFAVGYRQLALSRGSDRPLPTTLWYPATGGAVTGTAKAGAAPSSGRFPVVLLSHGLRSLPSDLAAFGTRWAAAGFVVAAPAFPHTKRGTGSFDMNDVANQPADGSYVISQVLALNTTAGDPLAGHLNPGEIAATGHSAGGYTTTGMLTGGRDNRLRAAIVLSGGQMGGAYTGSPVPVLFVHGDADPTVPYDSGRAAYNALTWPKAFLTLTGGNHHGYVIPGGKGFNQVATTTTDFLRWTLYGDTAAQGRLAADATAAGTSRWESTFWPIDSASGVNGPLPYRWS